ncbi:MAG: NADH-quinone oxidoreductase subunit NuoH [Thermoanaerobaculia bacterium]
MSVDLTAALLKIALFLAFFLGTLAPIMVWVERRACALIQDRPGPNRLGPWGLLQPLADALKFIFKEDITPTEVEKPLFLLAPVLAMLPALSTFVVLPFGPPIEVGGRVHNLVVADVESGVLLFLALSSLGVYALVSAGYSSNNKFSLLGSIRASAQLISYELALTLAVLGVLLPVGTFRLDAVVAYQQEHLWNAVPQAIGFLVFLVAMFAETNRTPFDLPEAESELVAGYHTEYSAMRFAAFMAAEYINMAALSALCATLYLGGWKLPFLNPPSGPWALTALVSFSGLAVKVILFMCLFVWVRWTLPRFRYDQLMRLGWKVLLPLSIVNLLWVAVATLQGWM